MRARRLLGCAMVWLLAAGAATDAAAQTAGAVHLWSTDAIDRPILSVHKSAEQAIGRPVVIRWGSARGDLKDAILAGGSFDVAILLPDVNEQLRQAGKIGPESFVIARGEIAIGQRGDGPLVDVSTPDALKKALLQAKAIRWFQTGAALSTVNKILDTLDIRAAATAKYRLASDISLGPGEYELDIYPLSEILVRRDLRNLGPVIPALQVPAIMTAVIAARPSDARAARALIAFLQGPTIEPALKANGFTR